MKPVVSVLFSQIVNSFLDSVLKANNCSVEPKRNKYRWLRVLLVANVSLFGDLFYDLSNQQQNRKGPENLE